MSMIWQHRYGMILCIFAVFMTGFAFGETLSLQKENWSVVTYDKIPPNQVLFQSGNLKVEVRKSAAPLVYKFEKPKTIKKFFVKGLYSGFKNPESNPFDEDSILRFGIVIPGENKLTGIKKWAAANWVKQLFALAPTGMGLDRIQFFNISDRTELLNTKRAHPKSKLIAETIVKIVEKPGPYTMEVVIEPPLVAAALWLSLDGDESSSEFTNEITEISVE